MHEDGDSETLRGNVWQGVLALVPEGSLAGRRTEEVEVVKLNAVRAGVPEVAGDDWRRILRA
jgi:hypothetical protein